MKSEIIDSSTVTFEPITLKITIESEKELKIVCERKTEHNRKPEKEWARE